MKRYYVKTLFLFAVLLCSRVIVNAQEVIKISGSVTESGTNVPLMGVNIMVKDKFIGTISNTEGNFTLSAKTPLPFSLVFSMVGYETVEKEVTKSDQVLHIVLSESTIFGQEVIVSASRIEQNILTSPVSIEKIGIIEIQESSSANFYDGLYSLKGVDMNVNSLTFRFPNTRGFNADANYRMNQLMDGVENVSPGLSFAAGNMFGLSELDVESVELLVGASSALYGSGGMNGTLLMTSKSPFDYQGLSISAQTGLMSVNADYTNKPTPMYDMSFRYAKAYNDKFAFKITGSYLQATDWNASDYRNKSDLKSPYTNPWDDPGYDGVNVYGDDILVPVNLQDVAPTVAAGIAESQGIEPGTPEYDALFNNVLSKFPDQVITRTGWDEKDFTDYKTTNLKLAGAVYYRLNENIELIGQGNYSQGSSLYTTTNRFAIDDFEIGVGKLELRSHNYFIRTWAVSENSGGSYDLGGAALRLNEAWKPSEDWYGDYIAAYAQSVLLGSPQDDAFRFARMVADNRDQFGNIFKAGQPAIPVPGSEEFTTLFNDIIATPVSQGGAQVIDKSKMWNIEGMYDFSSILQFVDLVLGTSYRIYSINSEGTVFADTPGNPISYYLFGVYGQLSKTIMNDRLSIAASARYDKQEYFEGEFTPRFSLVYSIDPQKEHNIRMSYQSAFRFPSTQDQWVNLDIGYYTSVGGLPEVQAIYNFNSNPVYPLMGDNPITDRPDITDGPFIIPTFKPEKVTALELGYKGLNFNKILFIDAYIYKNEYDNFLAAQLLAQNPYTPEEKRYQTMISSTETVSSVGWAFGADLNLKKGYYLKGNVAYNELAEWEAKPGQQSRYNTPDYRFNVGFGNRHLFKNIGFHFNYRWQNEFLWESNFGVALIPAYGTLDANVAVKISKIKSVVKIGGSNILNNYYTSSFGSSQIGGLYYISLTFDQFLN